MFNASTVFSNLMCALVVDKYQTEVDHNSDTIVAQVNYRLNPRELTSPAEAAAAASRRFISGPTCGFVQLCECVD